MIDAASHEMMVIDISRAELDAWGVESTAQGTTVWCELTVPLS